MAFYWCILIDLALLWFFCGNWILEHTLPKKALLKRKLSEAAKALNTRIRRDNDLLSAEQVAKLKEFHQSLLTAKKEASLKDMEALMKKFQELELPPFRHHGTIANNLEVLLVSIGVAFGIRSLFISPFRIPTGSMQPTLFGIHYVPLETEEISQGKLARIFDGLNYSRRYFTLTAPENGVIAEGEFHPLPAKPLFPKTAVTYLANGSVKHDLVVPADLGNTQKLLYDILVKRYATMGPKAFAYQKDEVIAQGAMESGDSLFVNRLSLCFAEPKRGDIMVFSTNGLTYNGRNLEGTFYVKRLVGLPGDTLKIHDRVLYVKPQGETDFFPMDGSYSRPFERIQSRNNGYAGHSIQPNGQYLRYDGDEFTVPAEMYFLMGDNTDNSLDCRFFGPIARERLVG